MNKSLALISVLLLAALPLVAQQTDTLRQKEPELPKGATELTSISFKDTDVRDIFRALSFQHNLNVFVDNSINKRTTISLNRVRVYDALKFICEQNNLVLNVEAGIFKILPPPKPEPTAPKLPWIYYDDGLLTVKLKNDDLEAVVTEIQKKCSKNILVTSGTAGSVSGALTDIDFDIGFTQIMNNNGFAVQKRSGIYIVSRLDYYVGQQTAQAQRAGPYWISVKDSLVTLDVTNAPLDRVITDITRQLNADVVFYNPVSGSVTARAANVTLSKALDLVLRNTNFGYRESEGIFFVGDKANKALLATRLIKLKYLRADKVMEMMPPSITTQSTMKVMKEHNGLVIIAPSDIIGQAEDFLRQIDKPVAQVLIEAIVVDYDYSKGSELGVEAGFRAPGDTLSQRRTDVVIPGIDVSFSGSQLNRALQGNINILGAEIGVANLGKLPSNFYLNLRALEQKGIANVKSRPLIATLNGHPASLSIGTTQYFIMKTTTPYRDPTQLYFQESQTFQTIEADVKLEITPYVGADGQITVEIKPDFRTPVGVLSPNIPPTINKRALSSTLVLREGETIVLGGLIQETESETRTQTPILGSIPILGSLFSSTTKSNRKSELIIYVTPHISYGEAFQNVQLPNVQK
jgi:type IV pilus assembly protein PilQ